MNRFLFILSLYLCCHSTFGQNLKVEQNSLVWQKIYYESRTQSDITRLLLTSGKVANIKTIDEVIVCEIPQIKFDYESAGFKRGNTPIYLIGNDFTAFVQIQIKEDRYRVTVSDIVLITNITTPLGRVGETDIIETYAVRNGSLTKSAIKYIEPILNEQFDRIFLSQPKLDNEW